jgi:hypothetical protein
MRWLLNNFVKPWHPTLMGLVVVPLIFYVGLPQFPQRRADEAISPWFVTKEQCNKIQQGMSEDEVRATLAANGQNGIRSEEQDCAYLIYWYGNGFRFAVAFDQNRTVIKLFFVDGMGGC